MAKKSVTKVAKSAPSKRSHSAQFVAMLNRLSPSAKKVIQNLIRAMTDDKTYLTAAKRKHIVKLAMGNKHAEVAALCGAGVAHG